MLYKIKTWILLTDFRFTTFCFQKYLDIPEIFKCTGNYYVLKNYFVLLNLKGHRKEKVSSKDSTPIVLILVNQLAIFKTI